MINSAIDRDTMIKLFSEAATWQAEAVRQVVSQATQQALQARAMALANLRKVLTPGQATTSGAWNASTDVGFEAMLSKAFAGIDAALLQTVQTNRRVVQQFASQGADLQENCVKSTLAGVEKMEDACLAAAIKASRSAGGPLLVLLEQLLNAMQPNGNGVGSPTVSTVEHVMTQAQTALHDGRAVGLRAAQVVTDGCTALASGALTGLFEGLLPGARAAPAGAVRRKV